MNRPSLAEHAPVLESMRVGLDEVAAQIAELTTRNETLEGLIDDLKQQLTDVTHQRDLLRKAHDQALVKIAELERGVR